MTAAMAARRVCHGSLGGRPAGLALALLVAVGGLGVGCSDAAGPCDRRHACEVDGPDLAIVAARVLADSGYLSTGVPLAAPAAIRIAYVVRNRGSEVAPAVTVTGRIDSSSRSIPDSLAALAPGDSVAGTLTVEWPAVWGGYSPQDSVGVQLRIVEAFDSDSTNDTRTAWMHPALPLLALDFPAPLLPRVRVNDPFEVSFTITNRSEKIHAVGYSVWLCQAQDGDLCFPGNFAMSGLEPVPVLGPGESFAESYPAKIGPAGAWQDEDTPGWITACIHPPGWTDPYLGIRQNCTGGGYLRVMPDYEGTCHPPLLVPGGAAITLTEFNCGLMPPTTQGDSARTNNSYRLYWTFHLYAADLRAGQTYHLDWAGKPRNFVFNNADGEHGSYQEPDTPVVAPRDGRYYFRVLSGGDPVVTVMLVER